MDNVKIGDEMYYANGGRVVLEEVVEVRRGINNGPRRVRFMGRPFVWLNSMDCVPVQARDKFAQADLVNAFQLWLDERGIVLCEKDERLAKFLPSAQDNEDLMLAFLDIDPAEWDAAERAKMESRE